MSSIIKSQPGVVTLVQSIKGAPGFLRISGWPGGREGVTPAIITSVGYGQQVNIQFMPTLSKLIYVYAFGDKMGSIKISGIAFDRTCANGSSDETSQPGWGLKQIMEYYEKNRAVKDGKTVSVTLAGTAISGFLESMNANMADPVFRTMTFDMMLRTIPGGKG